ncbi:unnamed protein product [Adineta ricciae]|uniref:Uncharacterized protein n=2 Tax=Adineta ricciae TaxID=249248 RepID=A0A815HWC9_ADIRI|nr:unnamed protein product [Adineta ricciae]
MLPVLIRRVWQAFLQLNLYKNSSSNDQTACKEYLATRIYVCCLAIAIIIVTITTSLITRLVNKIEYSPSFERFLVLTSKYPNSVHCPCTKVGIGYDAFVATQVRFHQVCSSQFVEQTWIDMMFAAQNRTLISAGDFRTRLIFFWQLIAGFCTISNRTWSEVVVAFDATQILSQLAMSEDLMRTQVYVDLNKQIAMVQSAFIRDLRSIRQTFRGNQMVSGLGSNFYMKYSAGDDTQFQPVPQMAPQTYNNCTCLNIAGCPHPATFNDRHNHLITVPGMISDCLVLDGALASTFECYYNETCISLLHETVPITLKPLSNDSDKHFVMKSTIETLLNEMMIDEMSSTIRFDLFYDQCQPMYCAYSYAHRFDVLFVFTTFFGIFGGLSFILKQSAPLLALIILRRKNRVAPGSNAPVIRQNKLIAWLCQVRILFNYITQNIINLNLFETQTLRSTSNIFREKLLTRVFLLLIIVCSVGVGIYIFFVGQSQVITVPRPTYDVYQQLYDTYSDALKCPCQQVSIPYKTFMNVTFELHQVCSSDLISSNWLDYIASIDPIQLPPTYFTDFRASGTSYFELLAIFCTLTNNHIRDAQGIFTDTQFINDHALAAPLFIQQTATIIQSYIAGILNDFQRSIDWVQVGLSTNQVLVGTNTNFYIFIDVNGVLDLRNGYFVAAFTIDEDRVYAIGFCGCGFEIDDYNCYGWNFIFPNGTHQVRYDYMFPEVRVGCMPLNGFFASTFAWWYNKTYLNRIQETYASILVSQSLAKLDQLDISVTTRFRNETMEDLLRQMFLETSTTNNTDFKQFYEACAPSSCSYTIKQRRDAFVLLLLFISICGGLNRILRIFVPSIGKVILFFIDYRKNRALDPLVARFKHLTSVIYNSITNLNLYKTELTNGVQLEKIYTRIYILLFTSSLGVLLFYNAVVERSVTKTYPSPSIADYERLLNLYPDNVNCPCAYLAIPYDNFIKELRVAGKCNFIREYKSIYYDLAMPLPLSGFSNKNDFRNVNSVFIRVMKQLCTLAERTIEKSLLTFRNSNMFVKQMISRQQFANESNKIIHQFQEKLPIEFARTLNLIRTILQGNALFSQIPFNWQIIINEASQGKNATFRTEPVYYFNDEQNTNCTCAAQHTCTMPAIMYNGSSSKPLRGFKLGCYSLETVLLSSLSCFYFRTCIDDYRYYTFMYLADLNLVFNGTDEVIQLNSSLTRFNIDDTIETIAYELFIESWMSNVSYERFFNSCAPSSCTYKYYYRFDVFELLTVFLSVYAGLSTVIRFIVPYFVSMIRNIRRRICT